MADLRRVPPGRAGRLWLIDRLHSGRLAIDLLDRKVRILRTEQERFALLAARTREHWQQAWREADQWGLRAAVIAGVREVRLTAPPTLAQVDVAWASVMGVRYPAEAACRLAEGAGGAARPPASAALVESAAAYRRALAAGVACAAAEAACRVVDAEIAATRRRLRAIEDRWVPRLEAALSALNRQLDETERADIFRLRWTAARGASERQRTSPSVPNEAPARGASERQQEESEP
ncbi:MAG TPA: V-type ATP synthase subunit D [Micromonosporaceae bacterium]